MDNGNSTMAAPEKNGELLAQQSWFMPVVWGTIALGAIAVGVLIWSETKRG
jgi:hypothetical protein